MKSTVSLQVDTDILRQLTAQLRRLGGTQDISEAITAAVAFWLKEQVKVPAGADPAGLRGYQWKSLFLPEGTVLRSWSYGEHNYARVEGDRIIHQGRSVSPNQFAQSFARSTRNAWNDLFVRRPGDRQFKLACHLRRELTAQEKAAAQQTPTPQTDPASQILAALLSYVAAPAASAAPVAFVAAPAESAASVRAKPAVAPPSAARRHDGTPAPGWNLPERRQFRYRLEDVAFD